MDLSKMSDEDLADAIAEVSEDGVDYFDPEGEIASAYQAALLAERDAREAVEDAILARRESSCYPLDR